MRLKTEVMTFTCFFGNCTVKNKDIALKISMHVACMHVDNVYSVFYNLKILDFIGWVSRFVERLIVRRLAFFDCVLL